MNIVLVKSTNGIIFGAMMSISATLLTNAYYNKQFSTVYDFFKIKSYVPALLGGLLGFSFGYTGRPLIYNFLFKSKKY
jgi:hypothetical protein